jgi:hypothetical protein
MATIKEGFDNTVDQSIAQKTADYSIAKTDVSNRLLELADLLGATLANADLFYSQGWFAYTLSPFALYCAKQDNVSGDVTVGTNWMLIGSSSTGGGNLVSSTDIIVTVVPYQPSDFYVPYGIDLSVDSGKLISLRLSGVAGTNTSQLAYAVEIDTSGANDGDSVIIQLDNKGIGMSTLSIDGTYNERLCAGGIYLFTKTTDTDDVDGYVLNKIGQSGIRAVTSTPIKVSPGKYLAASGGTFIMPLAAGLEGEEVAIICSATGVSGNSILLSGSDTLVNIGGLGFQNIPLMRLTSDGVSKWYYTN